MCAGLYETRDPEAVSRVNEVYAEIGRLLGVSESRVSQILAGIRRKLHDALASYDIAAAA